MDGCLTQVLKFAQDLGLEELDIQECGCLGVAVAVGLQQADPANNHHGQQQGSMLQQD